MLENIRLSFQGIWSHKVRSALTMIGIIIGIAAIIGIYSTIKGTNEQIKQNLVGAGNNTVEITLMQNNSKYWPDNSNIPTSIPILDETLRAKLMAIPEVEDVTYYLYRDYSESMFYDNTQMSEFKLCGVDMHYFQTCGYISTTGRTFVEKDFTDYRKVAVIDKDTASTIFPSESPLGKRLEINGDPFTIVGVVDKAASFRPVINSLEDYQQYVGYQQCTVYVPYADWPIIYCYDERPNVIIKAVDTDSMSSAGTKATDLINQFIGVSDGMNGLKTVAEMEMAEAASNVNNLTADAEIGGSSSNPYKYAASDVMEIARNLQALSAATNQQLILVAAISLVVGAIGVANIMLVSVTERTQEIGLKKAIGARKSRIRAQFLTEAAVLTSIGGILGVIVGLVLAQVLSRLNGTPVATSIPSIVIAVVASVGIGIVAGMIPAFKASNMDPIDALRHE